ncbi:MAG TPA: peptide chain release factor N(5)-glutamine methyltransferase [Rectinemataceae bacterium]
MRIGEYLALRAGELEGSDTPYLDASLILAHALGLSRTELLSRLPLEMESLPEAFESLWIRRLKGEAVSSILGSKEFFGREFAVDASVLCPRPDTEILVETALEIGDGMGLPKICLHDLCTGSGAVAISIKAERPSWDVSASDLSEPALEIARANAQALLDSTIPFFSSDLLSGIEGRFDIITANPPYVTSAETDELLASGWKEPRMALDGGEDGLDFVRRIASQAPERLKPGGWLLIETDALQVDDARSILVGEGFESLDVRKDLGGRDRITLARIG